MFFSALLTVFVIKSFLKKTTEASKHQAAVTFIIFTDIREINMT